MVKLTRLIRDIRPHVVITMAPDGGTGHADHIRISDATTRAFKLAAHPGYMEPGGLTHAPTKLYYFQIPRSVMRQFMEAVFTVGQYNLVAMYLNSLGVRFEGFPGQ